MCGSRGWLVVGGKGGREGVLKGGGGYGHEMATCVWLLEVREVTVTLVTSLRREGIREATKTLL